jgi:hypothetical protein
MGQCGGQMAINRRSHIVGEYFHSFAEAAANDDNFGIEGADDDPNGRSEGFKSLQDNALCPNISLSRCLDDKPCIKSVFGIGAENAERAGWASAGQLFTALASNCPPGSNAFETALPSTRAHGPAGYYRNVAQLTGLSLAPIEPPTNNHPTPYPCAHLNIN